MNIASEYDIIVVIGGCVTREGDYGFPNARVVYISPNLANHDHVSNATLVTLHDNPNSNICAIFDALQNVSRADVVNAVLSKWSDDDIDEHTPILWTSINSCWYLGDSLLDRVREEDYVYIAGWSFDGESTVSDTAMILEHSDKNRSFFDNWDS